MGGTPKTEAELLSRAEAIAGLSLAQLARYVSWEVPENFAKAKGWVGQLLEVALGAQAGTLPQPDFYDLGIELKTLPLYAQGKPRESTYVCAVSLLEIGKAQWETSLVYRKLARVLWIPIEANPEIAIAKRRIGTPFLWSPTAAQATILRQDWEELTEMMSLGQLDTISAKYGTYLQVRPKAASAKSLCWGIGTEGEKILTLPRGFYLRAKFTAQLL